MDTGAPMPFVPTSEVHTGDLVELLITIRLLRRALVGLVGSDDAAELAAIEKVVRAAPMDDDTRINTLAAIHALVATKPIEKGEIALTMHPNTAALLRFFQSDHLPADLRPYAEPFEELAVKMAERLDGPELTAGLRKLLEAKDCMVRAALDR